MICPRLASEVRLFPGSSVDAAREGPVREPALAPTARDNKSIVDPTRAITIVSDPYSGIRGARPTVSHPIVQRVELQQKLKPVKVILLR
jgi:hypothetical protein